MTRVELNAEDQQQDHPCLSSLPPEKDVKRNYQGRISSDKDCSHRLERRSRHFLRCLFPHRLLFILLLLLPPPTPPRVSAVLKDEGPDDDAEEEEDDEVEVVAAAAAEEEEYECTALASFIV